MKKDPVKYEEFYKDFSLFMKEAIVSSANQSEKVMTDRSLAEASFWLFLGGCC